MPFFSTLVGSRRAAVANLIEIASYDVGEHVFREGDSADMAFYILSEGSTDCRLIIARLLPGGLLHPLRRFEIDYHLICFWALHIRNDCHAESD